MLPIERYDVRELRHLRQRLHDLRTLSTGDGAALRLTQTSDPTYLGQHLRLQDTEEEAAELQYVLNYFDRLKVEWTIKMQIAFAAVVVTLVIIAALAIMRLL
jgi:hypothetical protein